MSQRYSAVPAEQSDEPVSLSKPGIRTLGIVSEVPACRVDGVFSIHLSLGRIIDILAEQYDRVFLCTPVYSDGWEAHSDYKLTSPNIELVPQPAYVGSMDALLTPGAILRAYARTLAQSEHVFVRGMPPYAGLFYLLARYYRRSPVHWIVGDPVSLLKSHRRSGCLKDSLSMAYALQDRFCNRLGRKLTGGAFICNGKELADIYESPRTQAVVSSTITEKDFFYRKDTCTGELIRILFVGFVRPEKGLEYLIESLPRLRLERPWHLSIAGPWEQYQDYKTSLDARIERLGIADKISWRGYVACGPELWECLREHDIFVLPTLSEGTPRVLVEARANSLPIIATRVGGIPSSVKDGVDGILVPAKDPDAIAEAVNRVASDSRLRQGLILAGQRTVQEMTVEKFVDTVMGELV